MNHILSIFAAFLVGGAFGYVSQRGAFCMNSGLNNAWQRRDFTKIKAMGAAVAVQMVALSTLQLSGVLDK
ncbi:MAG: hypothetical protein GY822_09140 [Deltaproteobacteria bacterium]|nr:hypothetical protein [Deltaproteobacteria bacterium]